MFPSAVVRYAEVKSELCIFIGPGAATGSTGPSKLDLTSIMILYMLSFHISERGLNWLRKNIILLLFIATLDGFEFA